MLYSRPVSSTLPTGGKVLPITRWGEPVMHNPCAAVTAFDDELRSFVADMVATMYAADGVGLAANQVGHSGRSSSSTAPTTTTFGIPASSATPY